MHKFLQQQAQPMATQITRLINETSKADEGDDLDKQLEEILAGLDFTVWASLADDVEPLIAGASLDGAEAASIQIGFDTTATKDLMNIVRPETEDYAATRSAEMVGMRRNENGDLVENPNAEWRIDESTRIYLRDDIKEAISQGYSNDKLAETLSDSYGFSEQRAMMIARTETISASNQGALQSYKASGVVDAKQWVTANDDKVSEECLENGTCGIGKDGVIDLDDDFPSGDDAPPVHPNCRCVIVPVVRFDDNNNNNEE